MSTGARAPPTRPPYCSQVDFHPVVGGGDEQRLPGAGNGLQASSLGQDPVKGLVVVRRLVMEQTQMSRARHLTQLDADDVAGMSPVGLDRDGVRERVHGIE